MLNGQAIAGLLRSFLPIVVNAVNGEYAEGGYRERPDHAAVGYSRPASFYAFPD